MIVKDRRFKTRTLHANLPKTPRMISPEEAEILEPEDLMLELQRSLEVTLPLHRATKSTLRISA